MIGFCLYAIAEDPTWLFKSKPSDISLLLLKMRMSFANLLAADAIKQTDEISVASLILGFVCPVIFFQSCLFLIHNKL